MPNVSPDDETVSTDAGEHLVTYREAANILKRTQRTVHRLRAIGELRPVILTNSENAVQVRFRRADVEALLAARDAEPART